MIQMRFILSIGLIAVLGFSSCKKEYTSRYCDTPSQVECGFDSNMVNVRVVNWTGYPLCDFRVKYRTDAVDTLQYGTLDVEESTCYVKMPYTKLYPRFRFELGTGNFKIPDTLTVDTLPYNNMKQTAAGFYTFYIQIGGGVETETIVTSMSKDKI